MSLAFRAFRLRKGRPGTVLSATTDACIQERDPGVAILNVDIFRAVVCKRLSGFPFANIVFEAEMQAGERVMETFRMTGWDRRLGQQRGRHFLRKEPVAGSDRRALVGAVRLVGDADREAFRFFLPPMQRSMGAGHHDAEIVLGTDADLRSAHERLAAVAQTAISPSGQIQRARSETGAPIFASLSAFGHDSGAKMGAPVPDFAEAGLAANG